MRHHKLTGNFPTERPPDAKNDDPGSPTTNLDRRQAGRQHQRDGRSETASTALSGSNAAWKARPVILAALLEGVSQEKVVARHSKLSFGASSRQ